MKNRYRYQENLSLYSPILLDDIYKKPKVDKMLAILNHCGALLGENNLTLDIGCSAGFFSRALSPYFSQVVGMDIDERALKMASENSSEDNISYFFGDSMDIPFPDNSVDLIICNHVYEHVPDSRRLFKEISRILSDNGKCYLGAASRLTILEPHYHLPFLSWLPKFIANPYMRIFNKGEKYYENLKTHGGIIGLVSEFKVRDYTLKVLYDPDKYCARDMIPNGGMIDKIPAIVWRLFYRLLPSYIMILSKEEADD